LFIDSYNFQRPHSGIDGLVPADRFFGAAPEVLKTLKARVVANALDLARNGEPKQPFYLTGQVGGQPFSIHAEGERVILTGATGDRKEIDLVPPQAPPPPPPPLPPDPKPLESKPEVPMPLCPMGIVTTETPDPVEPPAPGTSRLDSSLQRLADGLTDDEGGHA